ncbi:MAG: sugar ABC transporter permease, partial [Hungatella sp.]
MTPSMFFISLFTILPLIFMICMAFTNYSKIDNHLMLFDWVGMENFKTLFDSDSILGSTFWSVLGWTLVWAFFATFTNYFFGMFLSLVINRKDTKAKGFWRFCLYCHVRYRCSFSADHGNHASAKWSVNVLLRNLQD